MPVVVERAGSDVDLTVTPVRNAQGEWAIGIVAGFDYVPTGPGEVASATWQLFTGTASVVVRLPSAVWDVGRSLFTSQARDPNGVVSVVGVGRVAGEITQAGDAAGAAGARQTVAALLALLASLNMALFVFNLIPLPPLDGGTWPAPSTRACAAAGRACVV
ncbi:site-2 protease family protein, partial [Actinomyces polynesiensis]|uniref:site-2 protease family protein n=1 Tax=Actinomyces polynesiensis TaxID=1325934 RepID=UPI001E47E2D4